MSFDLLMEIPECFVSCYMHLLRPYRDSALLCTAYHHVLLSENYSMEESPGIVLITFFVFELLLS